jgi:hypothetical protein
MKLALGVRFIQILEPDDVDLNLGIAPTGYDWSIDV